MCVVQFWPFICNLTSGERETRSPKVMWQSGGQSWTLIRTNRKLFCRVNVDSTSKVLREKTEQTVFGVLPVLQDYPVPREPQENPEWYLILSRDWWVKVPVTVIPCVLVWNSFQYFSCSFAMFFSICWIPFPLPVSGFHSFHISWKFENALVNMKISHRASFMMLLLYSSLWNFPKATKANGDWMVWKERR